MNRVPRPLQRDSRRFAMLLGVGMLGCIGSPAADNIPSGTDVVGEQLEAVSEDRDEKVTQPSREASPFQQWDGFAEGSWVEWEEVGRLDDKVVLQRTQRLTLQDIQPDAMNVVQTTRDGDAEPVSKTKPLNSLRLPGDMKLTRVSQTNERLEIAGRALLCQVEEYRGENEKSELALWLWSAPEVSLPPRSMPTGLVFAKSLALSPHVVRATYRVTGKEINAEISIDMEIHQWERELSVKGKRLLAVVDKVSITHSPGIRTDVTQYWCDSVPGRLVQRDSTTDLGGHQTQTVNLTLLDYRAN